MDLTYATILVLAAMVFVLAGMIGYVYWQQTRTIQHVQSLALLVQSLVAQPIEEEQVAEVPVIPQAQQAQQPPQAPQKEPVHEIDEDTDDEEEEDDRVSVEHVSAPPATAAVADIMDTDDLHIKTKAQLQKQLSEKGIPYAKSDNKTTLIELLKATA